MQRPKLSLRRTDKFYLLVWPSSIHLGIARGAIESFIEIAGIKVSFGQSSPLRDNPIIQDKLGRSEASLRAARAYLYQTVNEVWKYVQCNESMTPEQHAQLLLASTQTATMASYAVDLIESAAGTSSIFLDNPLERRIRDIRAASQNIAVRSDQYANAGKLLLGMG